MAIKRPSPLSPFQTKVQCTLAALLLGLGLGAAQPVFADNIPEVQRLIKQGQYPQALDKLESYLASKPRDAQGRFLKGLILTEMNKPAEAIAVFTRLTEDYPELPEVESDKGISLPQNELKAMIGGTSFAVSENQARPIHTGCLFEVEDSSITVVAVDGYRLALRRWKSEEPIGRTLKFVVPAAALKEAEKILGTIHVALGDNSGFGGTVSTPFHEDYVLFNPTLTAITTDGERTTILDNGKLLV